METRPRDSAPEKPLAPTDRRLPLSVVVFNTPTAIPGSLNMLTTVEFGATRLAGGQNFVCPQPFYDPTTRTIWIEGREYPLERVHYWERAKMATAKKPEPAKHNHRIGRVARPQATPE